MLIQDITKETTLEDCKKFLRENYKEGVPCVCCGQFVKLYRRPITSAMAYGLILLHKRSTHEYIHIEDFFKSLSNLPSSVRGDVPKLRYWNLIEMGEQGYYRVTTPGDLFVRNVYPVQSHVLLYNNKKYGFEGKEVLITDCLKNKFNYEQLMNGTL